ncbi:hypothetical protein SSS_05430 [Sarcoptes scabiei]|nr:hypothetical protein SSS_05430 [Sarcoptes scabiei]
MMSGWKFRFVWTFLSIFLFAKSSIVLGQGVKGRLSSNIQPQSHQQTPAVISPAAYSRQQHQKSYDQNNRHGGQQIPFGQRLSSSSFPAPKSFGQTIQEIKPKPTQFILPKPKPLPFTVQQQPETVQYEAPKPQIQGPSSRIQSFEIPKDQLLSKQDQTQTDWSRYMQAYPGSVRTINSKFPGQMEYNVSDGRNGIQTIHVAPRPVGVLHSNQPQQFQIPQQIVVGSNIPVQQTVSSVVGVPTGVYGSSPIVQQQTIQSVPQTITGVSPASNQVITPVVEQFPIIGQYPVPTPGVIGTSVSSVGVSNVPSPKVVSTMVEVNPRPVPISVNRPILNDTRTHYRYTMQPIVNRRVNILPAQTEFRRIIHGKPIQSSDTIIQQQPQTSISSFTNRIDGRTDGDYYRIPVQTVSSTQSIRPVSNFIVPPYMHPYPDAQMISIPAIRTVHKPIYFDQYGQQNYQHQSGPSVTVYPQSNVRRPAIVTIEELPKQDSPNAIFPSQPNTVQVIGGQPLSSPDQFVQQPLDGGLESGVDYVQSTSADDSSENAFDHNSEHQGGHPLSIPTSSSSSSHSGPSQREWVSQEPLDSSYNDQTPSGEEFTRGVSLNANDGIKK